MDEPMPHLTERHGAQSRESLLFVGHRFDGVELDVRHGV
jgi:hypothetical protein